MIFVIPIAFVAYFPSLYLLDKDDPLGLPAALQFASPVVAVAALLAGGPALALRGAPLPERRLVIELDGVEKTFTVRVKRGRLRRERREVRAVDGISFRVEPGELVGYVGPNGAGKSTTVKMLTGILVPSAGRISVAGLEPSRRRIQLARRIGVVFGQRVQLWWDLPLRDSFELLRHIYRVPHDRWRANLDRFCEVLELEPFLEHAGAPALARPAHARRADRRDAARPGDPLPRRADDRARRRRQGTRARVPRRDQPRARASPCC